MSYDIFAAHPIIGVLQERCDRIEAMGGHITKLRVSRDEYNLLYCAMQEIYGLPWSRGKCLLFAGIPVEVRR